jgi:phosphoribosylformylglycinamidine synthase
MGYEVLLGESCYTTSEAQKLSARINETSVAKVRSISGQWLYYVDLESSSGGGHDQENTLEKVKQLVQASSLPQSGDPSKSSNKTNKTLEVHITPRNTPSPWSSKATSIAQVCGLKARVERGRIVTIEFEESFSGDQLSFKDVIHDRMTESLNETLPEPTTIFAKGARGELVVVDIFADGTDALGALQDYNKTMGLGLDLPNLEYLVEQYKSLGRSPVRGHHPRVGNIRINC